MPIINENSTAEEITKQATEIAGVGLIAMQAVEANSAVILLAADVLVCILVEQVYGMDAAKELGSCFHRICTIGNAQRTAAARARQN